MAVVRVIDVAMLEYQSLISHSLASGICIMALVASATVCKRQIPMAVTISINANTKPKPAAKRFLTFQSLMHLPLFMSAALMPQRFLLKLDASTGNCVGIMKNNN